MRWRHRTARKAGHAVRLANTSRGAVHYCTPCPAAAFPAPTSRLDLAPYASSMLGITFFMPKPEMPSGALVLLILRVLRSGRLHGYAIAQRIHVLSSEVLRVEEGVALSGAAAHPAQGLGQIRVGDFRDEPQGTLLSPHASRPEAARGRALRLRPRERRHPFRPADGVVKASMTELFRRLRYLLNRSRFDQELADDLEFHREMAARAGGVRLGDTRPSARRRAGRVGLDVDRPAGPGPALRRCACCGGRPGSRSPPS